MTLMAADILLDDVITEPRYLVFLDFDIPLYLTNGPGMTWDGHDWMPAPITVGAIDMDAAGSMRLSVSLSNLDRTYGAVVGRDVAQDRAVKIWLTYKDGAVFAPTLFAAGVMDGATIGPTVNISVISRSAAYGSSPRVICAPPVFNHMPPPGTVLVSGNVRFILEAR